MEPGIEPIRVAHGTDIEPGGHERILDGVIGELVVSKDEPRGPMQPCDRRCRECREGLVIAGLRADDQVSLHRVMGLDVVQHDVLCCS